MIGNRDIAHHNPDPQDVIVGFFRHASDARQAIEALHAHGFAPDQIGAAFREAESSAAPKSEIRSIEDSGAWFSRLRQTYQGKVMEPARAEWSPGDFESSLSRLQIPPERARRLARELEPGNAIVTVNAGDRLQEAKSVLEGNGGVLTHDPEYDEKTRHLRPGARSESAPDVVVASTPFAPPQPAKPGHIQLFGEVLRVHKDKVSAGDVRVRKESVTQMETVQVPVTREHLVVEHTDGRGEADSDNTIRVPLSEEQVRIEKDTVLRDEYTVGKREVTQNQAITDDVRKERLLIDEPGADQRK